MTQTDQLSTPCCRRYDLFVDDDNDYRVADDDLGCCLAADDDDDLCCYRVDGKRHFCVHHVDLRHPLDAYCCSNFADYHDCHDNRRRLPRHAADSDF